MRPLARSRRSPVRCAIRWPNRCSGNCTRMSQVVRVSWRGSGPLGGESRRPLEPDEADQVGTAQVGVVQFCVDQVGGRIVFRLLMTCDGSYGASGGGRGPCSAAFGCGSGPPGIVRAAVPMIQIVWR
jgi:hypothetical protein